MSIQEDREAIAELLGGHYAPPGTYGKHIIYREGPADVEIGTLDGIASLWPKGFVWSRNLQPEWRAWKEPAERIDNVATIPCTGDELADRTRLLRLVLEARQ